MQVLTLWQEVVVFLDVRASISALEDVGNFARLIIPISVLTSVASM